MKKTLKQRKMISLDTKMKIIRMHEERYKNFQIRDAVNLADLIFRTIIKSSVEIKTTHALLQQRSQSNQTKLRDDKNIKMEEMLYAWILDCNDKDIEIDGVIIQEKARRILASLCKEDTKPNFKASNGWYEKFKTWL